MPVKVSVKEYPCWARAMWPRKGFPISLVLGCVQRMPCGFMIVTKSTSVSRWTRTEYASRCAVGSDVPIAATTDGESATERATAMA